MGHRRSGGWLAAAIVAVVVLCPTGPGASPADVQPDPTARQERGVPQTGRAATRFRTSAFAVVVTLACSALRDEPATYSSRVVCGDAAAQNMGRARKPALFALPTLVVYLMKLKIAYAAPGGATPNAPSRFQCEIRGPPGASALFSPVTIETPGMMLFDSS